MTLEHILHLLGHSSLETKELSPSAPSYHHLCDGETLFPCQAPRSIEVLEPFKIEVEHGLLYLDLFLTRLQLEGSSKLDTDHRRLGFDIVYLVVVVVLLPRHCCED
ncbi:unnamed protein product [Linum trigynum]|uniref:Uncharacterized protein n=1 Tax=Linum trigynum TaxID=586398 RepID=A0AAV2DDV9_9ROSI